MRLLSTGHGRAPAVRPWLPTPLLRAAGLTLAGVLAWVATASGQAVPVTSGLRLHLKADAGVTTSGSAVTGWADQSGNGFSVAQATASLQPTLVAASNINGHTAVRFDGANDLLNNTTSSLTTSGSPNTVFLVGRATAGSNGGSPFSIRRSTPLLSYELGFAFGAFYIYSNGVSAANNASMADIRSTIQQPFISSFRSTGPGTLLQLFVNGTGQAVSQAAGMGSESGSTGFTIGTREDSPTLMPWNGDLAEVLAYDRALTVAEREQVETYLSNKYGIVTAANPTPAAPAIAIYPFTGNTNDASGNAYNATNSGATLTTDRNSTANAAYAFDGTSAQMSLPNVTPLKRFGQSFSITAWVRPVTSANAVHTIMSNRTNVSSNNGGSRFGIVDNGATTPLEFAVKGGPSGETLTGATNLALNTWSHVAVTFQYVGGNANQVKLYVNGGLDASTTTMDDILDPGTQVNIIGGENTPVAGLARFAGSLDEVQVFDRALSAAEVLAMQPAVVAPVLTAVSPARNLRNAARSTNVALTFDQPMSAGSASATALKLFGSMTGKRGATYSGGGTATLTINPTADLRANERADVMVTTAAQSTTGASLAQGKVSQFIGAAGPADGLLSGGSELTGVSQPTNICAADFDGDGDQDLAAAGYGGTGITVWLNGGGANYSAGIAYSSGSVHGLTAADIDGDGDQDILGALYGGSSVTLFFNNGAGAFPTITSTSVASGPTHVSAGDLDGDGDLDLATANYTSQTASVRFNNGSGVFSGGSDLSIGTNPLGSALVDFDEDGDLDLAISRYGASSTYVYTNNGSGTFGAPLAISTGSNPGYFAAGDMDADGHADLVIGNYGSNSVTLAWGSGTGTFTTTTLSGGFSTPIGVNIGDVDGDGDLDLAAASYGTTNVALALNTGSRTFGSPTALAVPATSYHVCLADLDNDQALDLATANIGGSSVSVRLNTPIVAGAPLVTAVSPTRNLRNAARATNVAVTFDQTMSAGSASSNALKVFGSMTGLRAATYSGGGTSTLTINPTADFHAGELVNVTVTPAAQTSGGVGMVRGKVNQFIAAAGLGDGQLGGTMNLSGTSLPVHVCAADVDGDGDQDLVSANYGSGGITVWKSNGAANTFAAGVSYGSGAMHGVTAADVDNDGDIDILAAQYSGAAAFVFFNSGTGTFPTSNSASVAGSPTYITTGDLDGDGDLDLVTAGYTSNSVSVRFNNGSGVFSGSTNLATGGTTLGAVLADFDEDGDLDIAASRLNNADVQIFLNAGNGSFGSPTTASAGSGAYWLCAADFDGDGHADLAVPNYNANSVSMLWGSGTGTFTVTTLTSVATNPTAVGMGDIDGDGDLDLAVPSYNAPNVALLKNQGSRTFSAPNLVSTANGPYDITVADFNADDALDFATANYGGGSGTTVSVRFNTPPGVAFTARPVRIVSGEVQLGAGAIQAVSAADGAFDEAVEEVVKNALAAGATLGAQELKIRLTADDGQPGPWFTSVITVVAPLAARPVRIISGEVQLGAGAIQPVVAADGSFDNAVEEVVKNALAAGTTTGAQTLKIRLTGDDGQPGPWFTSVITVVAPLAARPVRIVSGEVQLGAGAIQPVVAVDGSFDEAVEEVVKSALAAGATLGAQTLKIRLTGEDGQAGPWFTSVVTVVAPLAARPVEIVSGEVQLGAGAIQPVVAVDGSFDEAVEEVVKSALAAGATLGAQTLKVRLYGDDGQPGPWFTSVLTVVSPMVARVVSIEQGEMWWDNEAARTPLVIINGNLDPAVAVASGVMPTGARPAGVHALRLRLMGEDGQWGNTFTTVVNFQTCTPPGTPVASSGQYSYFAGQTVTLSATTVPNATYSWRGPNGFSSTQQNPSITGATVAASGTYWVQAISTVNSCPSPEDSVNVRVLPPVTITTDAITPTSLCAGGTFNVGYDVTSGSLNAGNQFRVQLSDASGSFGSPTVIGGPVTSTATTGSISVTIPAGTLTGTQYRIRVVASSPAINGSDNGAALTITTPFTATATATPNPVPQGTAITFGVTGAPSGATYAWTGPNGYSQTGPAPTRANMQAADAGTYQVTVTKGACQSVSTVAVTVTPTPTLTSFSPSQGYWGTTVLLTGTDLSGTTAVSFNGTNAPSFTNISATQVSAVVPTNATTGPITLTTPGGTATSATNFTACGAAPSLQGFTFAGGFGPSAYWLSNSTDSWVNAEAACRAMGGHLVTITSATENSFVTGISGQPMWIGLNDVTTEGTFVWASGTPLSYTNWNAGQPDNGSGAEDYANINWFGQTGTWNDGLPTVNCRYVLELPTCTAVPAIFSFSPTSGPAGTSVIITGLHFSGTTSVTFNGTTAPGFVVNGAGTQITVNAPAGATTGAIAVTTPNGTATSTTSYIFPGTITTGTITPTTLCAGDNVSIPFTVTGAYNATNDFTAQLLDSLGTVVSSLGIALNSTTSGTISGTIPVNTTYGLHYRIRVVSNDPVVTGTSNGQDLTIIRLSAVAATSNSPVASGGTVQLDVTGVPGQTLATYTWSKISGGGTFSSSIRNPQITGATVANSGTYQVVVVRGGCSVTRTVSVTVNPPVGTVTSVGPISGTSFCAGALLSVPYTATGAFNPTNFFTAQLSNASGSFASGVQGIGALASTTSGTISSQIPAGTPAGTAYRIRVIASNPTSIGPDNGTNLTISTPFTVTAPATQFVAAGGTISLSVTGAPLGATYAWTGPGGYTSNADAPTRTSATVAMTGTYSVTVTSGSCSSTASTFVRVYDCSSNLAAGLPAGNYSQTGSFNGSTAQTAFNGAGWNANGFSGTMTVNFGASISFSRVAFTPVPGPGPGTGTLTLQVATNAALTAWTTIDNLNQTYPSSPAVRLTRTFYAAPVSGFGFRITGSWSGSWLALNNVTVESCPGPFITTFSPGSGPAGTSVTINGGNFTGATGVTFNGTNAPGFSVNGAGTQITVNAPAAGSTGLIAVTTPNGTGFSATNYTYLLNVAAGTISPTTYCAGAPISVPFTVTGGTFNAGNVFTAQLVDSLGSVIGTIGTLNGTTSGTINGTIPTSAPYAMTDRVRVIASSPAQTGPINGQDLTIINLSGATAVSNSPVSTGGTIQLNVTNVPGQTLATYAWTGPNTFSSNIRNPQISLASAINAGTYQVVVSRNGCSVTRTVSVAVNAVATVTSFAPTLGYWGTTVTITGTNMTGTTAVSFNGTAAASFQNVSATQVTAVVPTGATAGPITVTTPLGTATSSTSFNACGQAPARAGFTFVGGSQTNAFYLAAAATTGSDAQDRSRAAGGHLVTIRSAADNSLVQSFGGQLWIGFNDVATENTFQWFSGAPVTYTNWNGGEPNNGAGGAGEDYVQLLGNGAWNDLPASSTLGYVMELPVCAVTPFITAISPTSGAAGTSVTITGGNFTGTTSVSFNGTNAPGFSVNGAGTTITVNAPAGGTTGRITVVTATGSAVSYDLFAYPAVLATSAISPTTYCVGDPIAVPFTVTGGGVFNAGNVFTAQLLDSLGTVLGTIGTLSGTTSGTVTGTIPVGAPYSLRDRVRVIASSPATTGSSNAQNLTIINLGSAAATATSPVNPGSPIQFNVTGVPGQTLASYAWTGPNGFSANIRNPQIVSAIAANQGTYQVIVTRGGCAVTRTVDVLVNTPAGTVTAAGPVSPTTYCVSDAISVPFTATGAFQAGNVFTAQLVDSLGNVLGTIGTLSGTASGTIIGTVPANAPYALRDRVRVVSSAPVSTGPVNGQNLTIINLSGATATSNSPVSTGNPIQLNVTGVPGQTLATYEWSGPNGFNANIRNPQITGASAINQGTYQVVITRGACSVTRTVSVTVSGAAASITTTGPTSGTYCAGSPIFVDFTTTGTFAGNNVFTAQLSNASGSFAAPTTIGTVNGPGMGSGQIGGALPAGLPTGNGYLVRVISSNPNLTGSTAGPITVAGTSFTWVGGVDANWNNPANWSCGVVPGQNDDVTINPGGNSPVVGVGGAVCHSITINLNATLTVNATFTIYGNLVNNGTIGAGSGSGWVWTGGGGFWTVGGTGTSNFWHVTVNNTVNLTINQNITIRGNVVNGGVLTQPYQYFCYLPGTSSFSGNPMTWGTYYVMPGGNVSWGTGLTAWGIYNGGTINPGTSTFTFGAGGGTAGPIGGAGSNAIPFYNVVFNNPAGVNQLSDLELYHFWTNNYVFNPGTRRVTFLGANTQVTGPGTQVFYDIQINLNADITLLVDIIIRGDLDNRGDFHHGGRHVIFDGTVPQLILGPSITNFFDITFNNTVNVTLNQHIVVEGDWVNDGIFEGNGWYTLFGGTAAQAIHCAGGTRFGDLRINNAAGVTLHDNILIRGNFDLLSGSGTWVANTGTLVHFAGTGQQFINGTGGVPTFWGIVNNNGHAAVGLTLGTNVRVNGPLSGTGRFCGCGFETWLGGPAAQTISGPGSWYFHHVRITNAVSVTLNVDIHVTGNWFLNGIFLPGTFTVFFDGTALQLIQGPVITNFYHLTINNVVNVTLNQTIRVRGNFSGPGRFTGDGWFTIFDGVGGQTVSTCGCTRFGHLTFNNGAGVTLLSGIGLTGNFLNTGGFLAGGQTVGFYGAGTQTVNGAGIVFHHAYTAPGATASLGVPVAFTGNLTNDGTWQANLHACTFQGPACVIGGVNAPLFYHLYIEVNAQVTLAVNVNLRGDFRHHGVFIPATWACIFAGTATQRIYGTAVIFNFYDITVNNLAIVNVEVDLHCRHNLLNNGTINWPICRVMFFDGTTAQTIGGSTITRFCNLTCNNGAGVGLGNHIRCSGDFRDLAGWNAGGFTTTFDGAGTQGIYGQAGGGTTFGGLTFNNGAGVTLFSPIGLTGDFRNTAGFGHGGFGVTFNGTSGTQNVYGPSQIVFHHFIIDVAATVQLNLDIRLTGNWTNRNVFLPNGWRVWFIGTVAQFINGPAVTNFYHLTINNTVSVSLSHDIRVRGNFIDNGVFCGCGWLTTFDGTAPQTIACNSGNTRFHDITFANNTGVTLLDAIGVTGNWVNNGGFIAGGQLVLFAGTGTQTIGGSALSTFHHWQNTNNTAGGGVNLIRDVAYTGNWTNDGRYCGCGFLSSFVGTAQQTLTCNTGHSNFHHITLANTSTGGVRLVGDIAVTGNWLVTGLWFPQTYTVHFIGTVAQTINIGGPMLHCQFYGLLIGNTSAGGVSLGTNCPLYLSGPFTNNGNFGTGLNGVWANGGTGGNGSGGNGSGGHFGGAGSAAGMGGGTGGAQNFGGTHPCTFYNWTIQNPAGVNCNGTAGTATVPGLGIQHVLTLATGCGNLACGGQLTLLSNAQGTAMVVNQAGGGECTGLATMQHAVNAPAATRRPGYRHYATPMRAGTSTVNEFADDLPAFILTQAYNTAANPNSVRPFPTVFEYDETRLNATNSTFDRGWKVPTGATAPLVPGQGYSCQTLATTVVDITGVLQNGPVTPPTFSRGTFTTSGWNLMGNPYPAPIDWTLVQKPAAIDNALYVFKPTGQYTGTYASWVNGVSQNGGSKDLAAMQGFFVRVNQPGALPTLPLTNAVRHTTYIDPTFWRPAPTVDLRPLVRLVARSAGSGREDEAVVYFEQGATRDFDRDFDAGKPQLSGADVPTLWSETGARNFAINGLPVADLTSGTVIPLGVRVPADGTYTLTARELRYLAGGPVWLEDRKLGVVRDLRTDSTYQFTLRTTDTSPRFFLRLAPQGTGPVVTGVQPSLLPENVDFFPNPAETDLTIRLGGLPEAFRHIELTLLDVRGAVVRRETIQPTDGRAEFQLDVTTLAQGVYTLRLQPAGAAPWTRKVVVGR